MIVRALDANGDWEFGKGRNNYKSGLAAVSQNIQTRVSSFLGDCFFATNEGIDWFTFDGSKDEVAVNLATSVCILNTEDVTSILQPNATLDAKRGWSVEYQAQTTYSQTLAGAVNIYDYGTH